MDVTIAMEWGDGRRVPGQGKTTPSRTRPDRCLERREDDAIIWENLGGIIVFCNQAAAILFGYPADEMIGMPAAAIIPTDRLEEDVSIIYRICRRQNLIRCDTERQRRDGGIFPVTLTLSPVYDGRGCIVRVERLVRDSPQMRGARQ